MTQAKVRAILKANPDGLTALKISNLTLMRPSDVKRTADAMPDVYNDRWQKSKPSSKKYIAVYVKVLVPENTPYPETKK